MATCAEMLAQVGGPSDSDASVEEAAAAAACLPPGSNLVLGFCRGMPERPTRAEALADEARAKVTLPPPLRKK